jgi:hypothetical protein
MQKLSLLSLLICLELLVLLFSILILPINIKEIKSPQEINLLENNQKILLKGKVIKETTSTIKLDNNVSASYKHDSKLINKTIKAEGIITSYYSNKTIQITKLNLG